MARCGRGALQVPAIEPAAAQFDAHRIAAAIDIKTDRVAGRLLIQQWTWTDGPRDGDRERIDAALTDFEAFQLAR